MRIFGSRVIRSLSGVLLRGERDMGIRRGIVVRILRDSYRSDVGGGCRGIAFLHDGKCLLDRLHLYRKHSTCTYTSSYDCGSITS